MPITIDMTCGVDYLGVINGVGWYIAGSADLPADWEEAAVDGLLDVELLLAEGPDPSLTVKAGDHEVLYLPGPDDGDPCS
jgi:hypothetical protein